MYPTCKPSIGASLGEEALLVPFKLNAEASDKKLSIPEFVLSQAPQDWSAHHHMRAFLSAQNEFVDRAALLSTKVHPSNVS
jgi:hypothetical protein